MTYHRTGGTGGTRNSRRERHFTNKPNFNKSTTGGHSRRPSSGRTKHNPPTNQKDTPKQRYDNMMSGRRVKKSLNEEFGSRMIGRSKVTGSY